jgi:hypothetical protein
VVVFPPPNSDEPPPKRDMAIQCRWCSFPESKWAGRIVGRRTVAGVLGRARRQAVQNKKGYQHIPAAPTVSKKQICSGSDGFVHQSVLLWLKRRLAKRSTRQRQRCACQVYQVSLRQLGMLRSRLQVLEKVQLALPQLEPDSELGYLRGLGLAGLGQDPHGGRAPANHAFAHSSC